jgi:hypothetical protein
MAERVIEDASFRETDFYNRRQAHEMSGRSYYCDDDGEWQIREYTEEMHVADLSRDGKTPGSLVAEMRAKREKDREDWRRKGQTAPTTTRTTKTSGGMTTTTPTTTTTTTRASRSSTK